MVRCRAGDHREVRQAGPGTPGARAGGAPDDASVSPGVHSSQEIREERGDQGARSGYVRSDPLSTGAVRGQLFQAIIPAKITKMIIHQ